MNLIKVLDIIKKQIENLKKEKENKIKELNKTYDEKLKELEIAYDVNLKLNTACLRCEGTGKIDGSDGYEYGSRSRRETCPDCKGVGTK